MTEPPFSYPTAGLIRRLLAIVYDSLLLLGVAFAYGVLVWGIRKVAGDNTMEPLSGLAAFMELALLWVTLAGYYVLCWTKRGQTLGMKSWRLRLERYDHSNIPASTAWVRCVLAVLSSLPAGLGYFWVLFDKKGGCWHDHWTKTKVVLLPKESRAH